MISDAYAAGFFDGEGSIYVNKRAQKHGGSPSLKICVSNTYLPVLEVHKQRWGGTIAKRKRPAERWRDQWQWTLSTRQCRPMLEAMLPYLLEKRQLAELALAYLDLMALPAGERRDYSVPRGSGIRIRPEWASRRDRMVTKIRQINGKKPNARRVYGA